MAGLEIVQILKKFENKREQPGSKITKRKQQLEDCLKNPAQKGFKDAKVAAARAKEHICSLPFLPKKNNNKDNKTEYAVEFYAAMVDYQKTQKMLSN